MPQTRNAPITPAQFAAAEKLPAMQTRKREMTGRVNELKQTMRGLSGTGSEILRRSLQGEIKREQRAYKSAVRRAHKRSNMTETQKREAAAKRATRRERNKHLIALGREREAEQQASQAGLERTH